MPNTANPVKLSKRKAPSSSPSFWQAGRAKLGGLMRTLFYWPKQAVERGLGLNTGDPTKRNFMINTYDVLSWLNKLTDENDKQQLYTIITLLILAQFALNCTIYYYTSFMPLLNESFKALSGALLQPGLITNFYSMLFMLLPFFIADNIMRTLIKYYRKTSARAIVIKLNLQHQEKREEVALSNASLSTDSKSYSDNLDIAVNNALQNSLEFVFMLTDTLFYGWWLFVTAPSVFYYAVSLLCLVSVLLYYPQQKQTLLAERETDYARAISVNLQKMDASRKAAYNFNRKPKKQLQSFMETVSKNYNAKVFWDSFTEFWLKLVRTCAPLSNMVLMSAAYISNTLKLGQFMAAGSIFKKLFNTLVRILEQQKIYAKFSSSLKTVTKAEENLAELRKEVIAVDTRIYRNNVTELGAEIPTSTLMRVNIKNMRLPEKKGNHANNTANSASIDVCIDSGKVTLIRGKSGTGKSTLASIIAGMASSCLTSESLNEVKSLIERRKNLQTELNSRDLVMASLSNVDFENPQRQMTILEYLNSHCIHKDTLNDDTVNTLLGEIDIFKDQSVRADNKVSNLSGGQVDALSFVRLMLNILNIRKFNDQRPFIFIMDECDASIGKDDEEAVTKPQPNGCATTEHSYFTQIYTQLFYKVSDMGLDYDGNKGNKKVSENIAIVIISQNIKNIEEAHTKMCNESVPLDCSSHSVSKSTENFKVTVAATPSNDERRKKNAAGMLTYVDSEIKGPIIQWSNKNTATSRSVSPFTPANNALSAIPTSTNISSSGQPGQVNGSLF